MLTSIKWQKLAFPVQLEMSAFSEEREYCYCRCQLALTQSEREVTTEPRPLIPLTVAKISPVIEKIITLAKR